MASSSFRDRYRTNKPVQPVGETPQDIFKQTPQTEMEDISAPSNIAQTTDYTSEEWKPSELHYATPEWEAMRTNKQLVSTVKRYAKNVENKNFSDDNKAIEWFVGDRRWKDPNVLSTLKELDFVKGTQVFSARKAVQQDLEDLAYIKQEWDKLPGGFTRIGKGIANADVAQVIEGTGAILENIGKGILDPTILFGGLAGKAMGAAFIKTGAKEVTRQSIKRGLQTGTALTADFGVSGVANLAQQVTNIEAASGGEVDGWESLKAGNYGQAALAGGLGAVLSAPGHVGAFRPKALDTIDFGLSATQAKSAAASAKKAGVDTSSAVKQHSLPDGTKLTLDDIDKAKRQGRIDLGSGRPDSPEELSFDAFKSAARAGVIGPAERPGFTKIDRPSVESRQSIDNTAARSQLEKDFREGRVTQEDFSAKALELHTSEGLLRHVDNGLNFGYKTEDIARHSVHTWAMQNLPDYRKAVTQAATRAEKDAIPLPEEAFKPAYEQLRKEAKDFNAGPDLSFTELGEDFTNLGNEQIVGFSKENLKLAKFLVGTIPRLARPL